MSNREQTHYSNNRFLDTQLAMLKIEEDWLQSIGAPVKRLPNHIVEAVVTRVLLSGLPLEYTQKLLEDMERKRIIDKPVEGGIKTTEGSILVNLQDGKSDHQVASEMGGISHETVRRHQIKPHQEGKVTPGTKSKSTIARQAQPQEQEESIERTEMKQPTKGGLEYNTALNIVEYFRRALADIGYLGLSDDEMLKVTKEALEGNVEGSGAAKIIKSWLDDEFKAFRLSLEKAFGDSLARPQSTIGTESKRYTKVELLQKTDGIIQDFRKQLASFGWSWLLYNEVFEATKLALNINLFEDTEGKIDDTLQPIAWHIHVLLQETEYAHLRPILEEGLKSSIKEVLQATKAKKNLSKEKRATIAKRQLAKDAG